MTAAFRRGIFGTGVVRGNGLAVQQTGVVSLGSVVIQGDTNFASNVLLTKTTSVNTATNNTFLDSSSNSFTITRNGSPTQGSFTPYWPSGYWGWYFGGTGNYAVTNTGGIGATVTTFTIECWIYPTATPVGTTPAVIGDMQPTAGSNYLSFGIPSSRLLQLYWYDGAAKACTGNTTISLNTWTHIAVSVNANAITLYVNGVSQTLTGTTTLTNRNGSTGSFAIGQYNTASHYYTGYISNLSVLNGTAKYSTGFTPTTSPLSVSTTNQTLLACYSNRFIDSNTDTTAKTITTTGTPTVQAFQPFNPPAAYSTSTYVGSGYFNGSTDYLTTPTVTALQLGTGDFTIECWSYLTSKSTNYPAIFSNYNSYTTGSLALFAGHVSGSTTAYQLAINGASFPVVQGGTIVYNTWVHLAVVRYNGTISLYVNGTSVGTPYSTAVTLNGAGANFYIGTTGDSVSTSYINGYLSNFRVVKGTAVYTAAFAPPTAPVTAIANTSLLANFTNAGIYDTAVQNNAVTVGDAQVSTTVYKWSPTSMRFDGTGDWLTAIDGPQLQIGTGDFTIDGWVYLSATGVAYGIISKGTASTGWSVNVTSGNRLQFSYTSSNLTGATSLAATTWYYFAVVRSGSATGNLKIYLNGTIDATSGSAVTDNFNQTSTLYVGADRVGGSALNGYLQDVRVTKYARTISTPTATFSVGTATTYTPAVPDAPIMGIVTTTTNAYSARIGYMAPLLNGGSAITSYTAVSIPGGYTGTSVTAKSGTITVSGLQASNTYTFAVYATNAVGTSTYSAVSNSITTPDAQLGKIFILSDMDLALTDLVMLNTTVASGILKAKTYALATIYGSD